jgi:hypothetical protein
MIRQLKVGKDVPTCRVVVMGASPQFTHPTFMIYLALCSTVLYRKGAVAKLTENRRHHTEIARYFSGLNLAGSS